MPRSFNFPVPHVASDPAGWMPHFPNPADFQFNYYKLLDLAKTHGNGVGNAPARKPSVAIVGAGIAGMTAARELYRSGFAVHIFEASDRIGGRHYTIPVEGQITAMEMGAMRFPYFKDPESANCIFDYLTTECGAATAPFPNPGTAEGNTGIYLNNGWGPVGPKHPKGRFYPGTELIFWPADPNGAPQDPQLAAMHRKVNTFLTLFSGQVSAWYMEDWPTHWRAIANYYEKMSFSDLVFTPTVTEPTADGWFGGFGMTDEESQLFYTIGAGDGSWGAFYEIGAMWFLRCVIFGFNSNLQSFLGILEKEGLPYYNKPVHDTNLTPLAPPLYVGIQTFCEWLFYKPAPGCTKSLYEAATDFNDPDVAMYVKSPIVRIAKLENGLHVTSRQAKGEEITREFDYAIITSPLWASQLSMELRDFDPATELPAEVQSARGEQHNIASCKVFFPLKETYWGPGKPIPQLLVTDTAIQDAYGIQWSPDDPGVLLASYTWEDDAIKFQGLDDAALGRFVLDMLDRITLSTVGAKISDSVDTSKATILRWTEQPTYLGCAKLYRQRNWPANYALLAYNQRHSAASRLYFAGENYGVEGGWTEPALRLALDATILIIQHSGGSFNNGFSFAQYPSFPDWKMDQNYPVCK
jgi:monoamine oxidase